MEAPFLSAACPPDVLRALRTEHRKIVDLGYEVEAPRLDGAGASRGAVVGYVTRVVDSLKPQSRSNELVYVACGKLVHLRIRAREVPIGTWMDSPALALLPAVSAYLRSNVCFLATIASEFQQCAYERLCNLGLQSALKYEEMYLARLEYGRMESLAQFFMRMAAAATQWTTPEMAEALGCDPAIPNLVFYRYFKTLSTQLIIPATPMMLFGGRAAGPTASCYLLNPEFTNSTDAVRGITSEVASILLKRGGIGMSLQSFNKRPSDACRRGIMGVLKLLDSMVMSINSDSERPTGVCIYIEPWHCDTRAVLNMRGMLAADDNSRCDNLFSCLWVPDLFMDRYIAYANGDVNVRWTLFDEQASHLAKLHGDDFAREYCRLEGLGLGVDSIPIQDIAFSIVRSIIMTGSPFIMFKDACNRHYHMDTANNAICGSNLCTEIIQHADRHRNGVCNLASVNLARCADREDGAGPVAFNFERLEDAVSVAAVFVSAMMLSSQYPTENSGRGVAETRSLGIGIQGLHTLFLEMGLDMVSPAAVALNRDISERMLLAAMSTSNRLCVLGAPPFPGFRESKFARGEMPFDAYGDVATLCTPRWDALRRSVVSYGLYHAQFIALMPTVSSSQVTECSEGFSPVFTNMFSKVTGDGELLRPNVHLLRALREAFPREQDRLAAVASLERAQWSVSSLGPLPDDHPLAKFKTAFEYDQEALIDMCADRAPFVDQSQSLSWYVTEPPTGRISASTIMRLLVHAYKKGLKTGLYYCKIRKATNNGVFAGGDLVCSSCQL
ncbi:ribonucleotide reductase subunit 1 [Beluga whale alphaherpesvirus 1]|uniref:Ribonucleoside-diphosphate reductase large subunit n=1 Tax=Beluga whale alphaherpesvirus 1 TaxID=1434720 RepID=A0A286MM41_9ALPH|nr:ribonucleotide reductase subunit 1 [Beluga whale alphaherpesvirus 1]ASW27067.1 ribonucleotide reductase subunit 1 [Beluga whale alphaherpesvirus 1]